MFDWINRRFYMEIGAILFIVNTMCMHFLYIGTPMCQKLYVITECACRLLISLGVNNRNKVIKAWIATEITRLLYLFGWALDYYKAWTLNPEYVVPIIILGIFTYLDRNGSISNRKPLGLR